MEQQAVTIRDKEKSQHPLQVRNRKDMVVQEDGDGERIILVIPMIFGTKFVPPQEVKLCICAYVCDCIKTTVP